MDAPRGSKRSPVSLTPLLKPLPLWRFSRAFTLLSVSSLFRERDVLYIRETPYGHRNSIIEGDINRHDSWDKEYCASRVETHICGGGNTNFCISKGSPILYYLIGIHGRTVKFEPTFYTFRQL